MAPGVYTIELELDTLQAGDSVAFDMEAGGEGICATVVLPPPSR